MIGWPQVSFVLRPKVRSGNMTLQAGARASSPATKSGIGSSPASKAWDPARAHSSITAEHRKERCCCRHKGDTNSGCGCIGLIGMT